MYICGNYLYLTVSYSIVMVFILLPFLELGPTDETQESDKITQKQMRVVLEINYSFIHSFSILSDDRSKATSKIRCAQIFQKIWSPQYSIRQ